MCKKKVVHQVHENQSEKDLLTISCANKDGGPPPIIVKVKANGKEIPMELDTGVAVTIMSEKDLRKNFPKLTYRNEDVNLRVYNGTCIGVKRVELRLRYATVTKVTTCPC